MLELFSGLFSSLLAVIGAWLLNRKKESNKDNIVIQVVNPTHSRSESGQHNDSEVANIVKRFNQILALINENRIYDKFTIAGLARLMKFHSVGELESVFLGQNEPNFEFMDNFCNTFGINRHWLIEGKDSPFIIDNGTNFDPLQYLDEIHASSPEGIFFIRSDTKIGEVFIVLKFADWKYRVIPRIWHISDHVGAGGRRQIFGFYKLVSALQDSELRHKCGGRILEKKQFSSLLNGAVFPGSVIEFPSQENPWWDDFLDVHHKYPIASNYERLYGKGFVEAQYIVRSQLKTEQPFEHT